MRIQKILKHFYPLKGFCYGKAELDTKRNIINVEINARKNSKIKCSGCGKEYKVYYDKLKSRKFEFLHIFCYTVYFIYGLRRVNCKNCGVKVEEIPWATGKYQLTKIYMAFLASWAKDLAWSRVAKRFGTSWRKVAESVKWVVNYGLRHRDLKNIHSIGVDEIQYKSNHKYLTLVYQIDKGCRRLLWIGKDRTAKTFNTFFDDMEKKQQDFCESIHFICSDMWKAFIKVSKQRLPNCLHVLDRFHIKKMLSDAIDKTRKEETKKLKSQGCKPVLAGCKWILLKKRGNLSSSQKNILNDLLKMNLKTIKVYLLIEEFEHFWSYKHPTWAKKFLNNWIAQASRTKITPLKQSVKTLRSHETLILNWFRAKKEISNGITEALNNNAKMAIRKARGFKSLSITEIALYHQLGKLPEPVFYKQFW